MREPSPICRVSVDTTNGDYYYVFSLSSGGTASVTAFADDVVRVRFSYNGFWAKEEPMIAASLGTWPTLTNTFTDQGTNYLLQTGLLNVVINKNPFGLISTTGSVATLSFRTTRQMPSSTIPHIR
jgi:hypothetical protein